MHAREVETKLYTSQQHIRPAFVTDTSYGRMLFQVVSADISAHDVTSRTGYNLCMARGWESKAVEEQQAEARTKPDPNKVRLEPEQVAKQKERQGLLLSRQRVLQQLQTAQNPFHRKMLEAALGDLEAQLARLG